MMAGGMADCMTDVLVNRNMRLPLEIMDKVCRELNTCDGRM